MRGCAQVRVACPISSVHGGAGGEAEVGGNDSGEGEEHQHQIWANRFSNKLAALVLLTPGKIYEGVKTNLSQEEEVLWPCLHYLLLLQQCVVLDREIAMTYTTPASCTHGRLFILAERAQ